MTLDGVYIKIPGSTKDPHWLPHFVLDTLLLQEMLIKLMWMVWILHFTKIRRVFHLLFSNWWEFVELKILCRPKRKSLFYPPSYSKRFLFKDMISRGNLKNICSRLVLYGVILMKTYYMGNWANIRCYWSPRSQLWTKWFKFINKSRDKSPNWRKTKLPCSERFIQGLRIVKKVNHVHQCQYTTFIKMRKIRMFHPTNIPLLFCMMLHFQCI